jgi:acyl-coenzyme A synthetase/AMP-(fatty) acid ligase
VPRQIVVVDELPRTGTEKVQKRDLVPLFDAQ